MNVHGMKRVGVSVNQAQFTSYIKPIHLHGNEIIVFEDKKVCVYYLSYFYYPCFVFKR